MSETWRALPLVGFEGAYEVSDAGRLRRVLASQGTYAGYVFRPTRFANGYLAVTLTLGAKRGKFYVHELIALAFVGPRPPGFQVNHIDRDRTNNRAANLEYVTPSGNTLHGIATRGTGAKLNEAQVLAIRARLADGARNAALAREYGVDPDTISHIKRRVTWSHLP